MNALLLEVKIKVDFFLPELQPTSEKLMSCHHSLV